MKIGTAVSNITPRVGCRLMGYAERVGGSTAVCDDLLLQTIAFEQGGARALLISADLIGLAEYFFAPISQALQTRHGIPAQNIFMTASHNHSGPVIPCGFMDVGLDDRDYLNALEATLLADAALALSRLGGDYRVSIARGQAAFAVNRRKPNAQGEIEMLPNPDAPRDDEVIVIQFEDDARAQRVVLFHYACHATTLGSDSNVMTAEFPGAARRFIESALPGATALYLPGCAAEINPWVVNEKGEFQGSYADVLRLGEELGQAVLRALATPTPVSTSTGLVCRMTELPLPLAPVPPLEHFQRMAQTDYSSRPPWEPDWAAFARYLLADPQRRLRPDVPARLTAWRLADTLTLFGIGAEVSVEYGLQLKRLLAGQVVVPVGYTNDVAAYLSTRRQILEGGYEVELGNVWCNHPAPFAPESEDVLLDGARRFLEDIAG